MTIKPFAAGSYVYDRTTTSLLGMKSRLGALTTQLATGRVAETYGGLGTGRATSLGAHAAISALDGYTAAIDGATTRLTLTNTSLTQLTTLGSAMRQGLLSDLRSASTIGISQSTALARTSLDAAVDALNQDAGGHYVFGGRVVDRAPVVTTDAMLNGDAAAGLVGLRQLIAEQKAADLGASGSGRLTQAQAGATVRLTEDASAEARANFGFSLVAAASSNGTGIGASLAPATPAGVDIAFASQPRDGDRVRVAVLQADGSHKIRDLTARARIGAGETDAFAIGATPAETAANLETLLGADIASVQSADPPGVSATFTGGAPASLALSVGTPAAGDTVTLALGMHDGTTQTITLTAKATADAASATEFAIGATPADTAANLSRALANALQLAGKTQLAASSAARASADFFDGSPSAGLAPRRIAPDGNGYAETAGTGTVIWYQGDDTFPDPRDTALVRVGTSRDIAIGAQANEAPIRAMLAGLAAIAADDFTAGAEAQDIARFQAAAERAEGPLSPTAGEPSLEAIVSEFGVAATSMADAKAQAQATKATLQESLDGIETVSAEEVAAKLLSLQTQLQASYQVTGMLSKLTLANYIG